MRVFKTKWFVRFARKERIGDKELCDAVARAERGLIDADLGGGLIKQRLARSGQGKSGGYRSILVFQSGSRSVFAYGFAKNDRDNIDAVELQAFRQLASLMLSYDQDALDVAVSRNFLQEVLCNGL